MRNLSTLMSYELTAVEPIDDITIHMESPEIKDKLLVGQCIAIYINRSTSCIACNKIQPVNNEEEFVTYKNCKMTTLASTQYGHQTSVWTVWPKGLIHSTTRFVETFSNDYQEK